jgi:oxygen-independent coproporphyrinogen-3 oxidase
MYNYQKSLFGTAPSGSNEIYVGIPFCPTRCLYCSFASYQVGEDEINKYFDVLQEEISHCGKRMNDCSLTSESCYIGGGTPTTLAPGQLEELLLLIKDNFPGIKELTVEAGRPDTITKDKLDVLSDMGVDRISINPQSMKAETLERIGRSHTPQDIVDAFELANGYEFDSVNCDIIAGLPGEKVHDLENTLDAVIGLGADNITVHTLSVKRGSRLHEADKEYHYKASDIVKEMLELADAKLCDNGYKPYYLYRQKHMAGAMENTGYCRDDKACLYNVRVMDEHQSTLALGAGGISKKYYPDINRLVRVPNVSNYVDYIERIDEMIDRKEKEFFVEDKNAD